MTDEYVCVRLSSDEANRERIKGFKNSGNPNLVEYLRTDAWEEDQSDWNAVYLIFSSDDESVPVLFFALKCGMISSPFPIDVLKLLNDEKEKIIREMPEDKLETLEYIKEFIQDAETNASVNKVASTIPGVELSHFCMNEAFKEKYEKIGIKTKGLGEFLFYNNIVPVLREIRERVGCRFMYLFAADASEDRSLIRYYREHLGFVTMEEFDVSILGNRDIVPIMPLYDYQCEFMIWSL